MKVAELRKKLAALPKDQVVQLASEFYKLVPKAKREDYALDDLINNPKAKKKTAAKAKAGPTPLPDLAIDIRQFTQDVDANLYVRRNRSIPEKQRRNWRHTVKRWFKELTLPNYPTEDLPLRAELLTELYELLCKATGWRILPTDHPFQSVGVEQDEFYVAVVAALQEAHGKEGSLARCIDLAMEEGLTYNLLHRSIEKRLLHTLAQPALLHQGVTLIEARIQATGFDPKPPKSSNRRWREQEDRSSYRYENRHNRLTTFGTRFLLEAHETEEAVAFYRKHYFEKSEEIKLYILVIILMNYQEREAILAQLQRARGGGLRLRDSVVKLLNLLEAGGELPRYF